MSEIVAVPSRMDVYPAAFGAGAAIGLALVVAIAFQAPLLALFGLFAARRMAWRAAGWRGRGYRGYAPRRRRQARRQIPGPAPRIEEARIVGASTGDPDRRAVIALTTGEDEPLLVEARAQGLGLVDRLAELRAILADDALSAALRRPLLDEAARTEGALESLLSLLTGAAGQGAEREELMDKLAARMEVEDLLSPAR